MKLLVCIVQKKYSDTLVKRLNQKGYRVTKLASTGGFVKQGNDTLFIGAANEDIDQLQNDLKRFVLELEKEKRWQTTGHRMTIFVISGQNRLSVKHNR